MQQFSTVSRKIAALFTAVLLLGFTVSTQAADINGTPGNDVPLDGTNDADVIHGFAGNDQINGLGGDDLIFGGPDTDTINGGLGFNTIVWQPGDGFDTVNCGGSGIIRVFTGGMAFTDNGSQVTVGGVLILLYAGCNSVQENTGLPVELTSFDALTDRDRVTLTWETASETNNAGFEVIMQQGEVTSVLGFVDGFGTTAEAQRYEFTVSNLEPGAYSFVLRQIDFDGAFDYSNRVEVFVEIPGEYHLSSIYPNPFNPTAKFSLIVEVQQPVSIQLYNAVGQYVKTLFEGTVAAQSQQWIQIDAADLPSGLYLVQVTGKNFNDTRSALLMK